jgi:hypothetical protein
MQQPATSALPEGAGGILGETLPDLFVTQVGFQNRFFEQHVRWNDVVGPGTGGRVGSIDFKAGTIKSVWEVTVSSNFERDLLPRAQKVAAWARGGGRLDLKAVLAMDRGVFFQLDAQQRELLVNTVTSAGGYISVIRDLKEVSLRNARAIAKDLE